MSNPVIPPLSPAAFHILLALAGREKHGYAVMQEVEAHTGGRVAMGPGTLYGSLDRLQASGWVEECGAPRGEDADERRRYYRLTGAGRAVLKAEAQRLEQAVAQARAKGVLTPSRSGQS